MRRFANTWTYLASILEAHNCPTLIVGGVSDHVHALFVLSQNESIANIVYELKRSSSKWAKTQGPRKFHWQSGYGAFSVSESHVERVQAYIARQDPKKTRAAGDRFIRHAYASSQVADVDAAPLR